MAEWSGDPTGHASILLIDDEEAIRRLMKAVLAAAGYRVLQGANGDEALRLHEARGDDIHLVVTDILMPPGMDGLSLVESMRRRRPDLPVIFISGYTQSYGRLAGAVDQGRTWFLPKPFSPFQLVETVKAGLLTPGVA